MIKLLKTNYFTKLQRWKTTAITDVTIINAANGYKVPLLTVLNTNYRLPLQSTIASRPTDRNLLFVAPQFPKICFALVVMSRACS